MDVLLLLVLALTVGAVVFGVMTLVTGGDPGLQPVEPDSRARPLPTDRPLHEGDVGRVTFDVTWRGYRMAQVDQTLRRLAYDVGYKSELINVLEAEISALREGRTEDADTLAEARSAALRGPLAQPAPPSPDQVFEPERVVDLAEEDELAKAQTDLETDSLPERKADVSKSVS